MDSGFFNNTKVVSEDFATFVRGILTNGVTGDTEDVLKVTAAGEMKISIAPGYAWINGHYGVCESPEVLTIGTADGANPRIDRVVVRLDMSAAKVSLAILKGTAAASPSVPGFTRDGTIHELCLAEIYVEAGATSISDAVITDTRADKTLCGAVLANTRETLALDGKSDKTETNTLKNRITTAENDITAIENTLAAKRIIAKSLLTAPVSDEEEIAISADTSGCCPIRIAGSVAINVSLAEDGVTSSFTKDFELTLYGNEVYTKVIEVGEISMSSVVILTSISASVTASEIKITSTPSDSGGSGTTVYNYSKNTITIKSIRGAFVP